MCFWLIKVGIVINRTCWKQLCLSFHCLLHCLPFSLPRHFFLPSSLSYLCLSPSPYSSLPPFFYLFCVNKFFWIKMKKRRKRKNIRMSTKPTNQNQNKSKQTNIWNKNYPKWSAYESYIFQKLLDCGGYRNEHTVGPIPLLHLVCLSKLDCQYFNSES